MTWVRIDDRMHGHPKIRSAGLDAMGMWVLGLSYCGCYLTDGVVRVVDLIPLVGGEPRVIELAERLVSAGLWDVVEGGWMYHDYLDYNPSAEQVKAEQKRKVEAGRMGGIAKAKRSKGASTCLAETVAPASLLLEAPANVLLDPPSRPDPYIYPSSVPNIGSHSQTEHEPKRPTTKKTHQDSADARYRSAYVAGIVAGSGGQPYVLQGSLPLAFKQALTAFGGGRTGDDLLAWLTESARKFRAEAPEKFNPGFTVSQWVKWLNTGKPVKSGSNQLTHEEEMQLPTWEEIINRAKGIR